jgi:hypothetical protein
VGFAGILEEVLDGLFSLTSAGNDIEIDHSSSTVRSIDCALSLRGDARSLVRVPERLILLDRCLECQFSSNPQ